ncbi:MAG: hypothetical protein WAN38_00145 [Terriglobales bacterium]
MGAPFLAPFARSGPLQGLQSGRPLLEKRGNWEGTIRAESNPTTRAFSESLAFAPFGERYALKGAPYNVDSFTGSPDQLVSDEYDFTARLEMIAKSQPIRGFIFSNRTAENSKTVF